MNRQACYADSKLLLLRYRYYARYSLLICKYVKSGMEGCLLSHSVYVLTGKLPFSRAPKADRNLPDMHLSLYNEVVVFDQATKLAYVCVWLHLDKHLNTELAFLSGKRRIAAITQKLNLVPTLNNAKVSSLCT